MSQYSSYTNGYTTNGYNIPQQASYGIPQQPSYGATHSQPSYQMNRYHPYTNQQQSYNNNNNNHNNSIYSQSQYSLNTNSNTSHIHTHSHPYSHSTSSLYNTSSNNSYNNYNNRSYGHKKQRKSKNEYGITMGQPGSSLKTPNWSTMDLPKFQKNFYRENPNISKLTENEIIQWRKDNTLEVIGTNIPKPIFTFKEAGFPPYIMTEIEKCGFKKPTAIQSQGWPFALSGRNVIGIAETGSGKTLAFILPSIVHINAQPLLKKNDGPIVLIIEPTRELAMQVEKEVYKFAYSSKIKHTCVYGGVSRREQIQILVKGVEILICTPGRLLDFLECNVTNLFRVTYLVIDEADRLLDMGFEPQLTAIFSQVRPDRQILMWSATWPKDVRELSKKFLGKLNNTLQVICGNSFNNTNAKANENVEQQIEIINQYEKQSKLLRLLTKYNEINNMNTDDKKFKVLVFISTKKMCDEMFYVLKNNGILCTVIHGGKQQYERDLALNTFKKGHVNIMIATDIASRGIHVDNIKYVINYDFPNNLEDYVHRIGRTGRCGEKGIAISFFTSNDCKKASKLINVLKATNQHIPNDLIQMELAEKSKRD